MDYTVIILGGARIVHLTRAVVQAFFEDTMSLEPKHVNALGEERVTYPKDLSKFDSIEFESVVNSMKRKRVTPPGVAQIRLKQACDFFQYTNDTGRTMKDQYLGYLAIKSYAIQVKVIKDQKESKDGLKGFSKLSVSMHVLSWIDK